MHKKVLGYVLIILGLEVTMPISFLFLGDSFRDGIWLFFPLAFLISLISVKVIFNEKPKFFLLHPLSLIVIYTPINVLTGLYESSNGYQYYTSYPRYEIILYFSIALLILYMIVALINKLTNSKYAKVIYVVADVLSIPIIFIALLATTFVSPH